MQIDLFKDYKKKFLDYLNHERHVSACTLKSYESDLEQVINFWEAYQQKKSDIFDLEYILQRYERWLFAQKLSTSSIARKCSCLSSLKRFFIKSGITVHIDIIRPRVIQKIPCSVHIQKLMQLFDGIHDEQLPTKRPYRDRAILELLYATGMRCSELANLKLQDINFEEKIITVSGSKERLVLFGTKAHERLLAYIHYERGELSDPEAPLLLSYRNTPLTARSIQRICLMFSSAMGEKKKITPALLRNSFATHLLTKGADTNIVKQLLGYTTQVSIEKYLRKNKK